MVLTVTLDLKPKLKICGMRDAANMRAIAELKPDFFGLIFYAKSPRCVTIEQAQMLPQFLGIERIGVFVNENLENVLRVAEKTELSFVQLHGAESPEFCGEIKRRNPNLKVVKAFAVDNNFDGASLKNYETTTDFYLFDTKTNAHGGSGRQFDWRILQNLKLAKPFFLGGGIAAENAAAAIAACANLPLFALDANSRAEIEPGVKSAEIVEKIIKALSKDYEVQS